MTLRRRPATAAAAAAALLADFWRMTISPQRRSCSPRALLHIASAVGFLLLAGCANGDFGEIKPSLTRVDMHDWVGPAAAGGPASTFQLTDDERQLRDLAYPLVEPPYDRQRPSSILGEYGQRDEIGRSFDRTAYAAVLLSSRYRSPAARYAQLIDDIRNDTTRLPEFFENAARVADIDAKRRKSFRYIREVSDYERANAARRMNENASIIAMVQASLDRRAGAYQFALERMVIATPSPQAVEAEHALERLKAGLRHYRRGAPLARGERVAIN
jgi:hypothetical protein